MFCSRGQVRSPPKAALPTTTARLYFKAGINFPVPHRARLDLWLSDRMGDFLLVGTYKTELNEPQKKLDSAWTNCRNR